MTAPNFLGSPTFSRIELYRKIKPRMPASKQLYGVLIITDFSTETPEPDIETQIRFDYLSISYLSKDELHSRKLFESRSWYFSSMFYRQRVFRQNPVPEEVTQIRSGNLLVL